MDGTLSDLERRALRRKAREAVLSSLRALGGEAERHPLLAHAEEHGGFTERELTATAKDRRLVDHELSWSLTNVRRDGLVANPRRSVWALAGAAAESTGPPVPITVAEAIRIAELREMPYREYLRTPEWRRTRAAALHRANNPRRAARRKAKRKAVVWDVVLRLALAGGLLVGLLGMLER